MTDDTASLDEAAATKFWLHVEKTETCWIWHGRSNGDGYGLSRRSNGKTVGSHRLAYMLTVGPIPEKMQLDHLCRNRACVNPAHLEPVTARENVNRGLATKFRKVYEAPRDYGETCPLGHRISGENAQPQQHGKPRCRECNRVYMREYMRARHKRLREEAVKQLS